MSNYAAGKYAYGISDRSGFRYRLKDMREEWNGLLVGPDEYEPKHPQLEPRRRPTDPEALRDPRPDTSNSIPATVQFPSFDLQTFEYLQSPRGVAQLGSVTLGGDVINRRDVIEYITLEALTSTLGSVSIGGDINPITQTFSVHVQSTGYGNKYFIDMVQQPTLNLNEGSTYRFDQSGATNSGHGLRFSTTSDGTHGGGTEYTTGVSVVGTPGTSGAYTQIEVASGAPTLYYYCVNHSGMGGQANTP